MNRKADVKIHRRNEPHKLGVIAKIIGNILFAVLIITIGFFVFFAIRSRMTGTSPQIAGYSLYIVLSGSMEPALHTGSLVLVQPVKVENLAINDIITFEGMNENNQLITHRIVAVNHKEQLSFSTKGDANADNDPQPVFTSAVVGKVGFAIPYIGFVLDFVRTKIGLLVLVIIPGALIAILEMWKLHRYSVQFARDKNDKNKAELNKEANGERGDAAGKEM